MKSNHDARERYGFGSRWIKDKDGLGDGTGQLTLHEQGLKLLNQMKALREDNPTLLNHLCGHCGRWVMIGTYGDEPYTESQISLLHTKLKALGVDAKNLRVMPPPPKPQPRAMDGSKLLAKMKGLKADLPDDFKLVVESHKWVTAKVAGTVAFSEEQVAALLATLDELNVDVKTLREVKPEMDGGKLLAKMRGLDDQQPNTFDRVTQQYPWLGERVKGTDAFTEEEVTLLLASLADLNVDLKRVRDIRKPRLPAVPRMRGNTRLVRPGHDLPTPGGRKSRWGDTPSASERITLPTRAQPVTAPDGADMGVSAQIFRNVLKVANTRTSALRFGATVRRISAVGVQDMAGAMISYGAFAGEDLYRACEELERRLDGLAEWHPLELAALLSSLHVDPLDILKLFTKRSDTPEDGE
ncbi:MAG: hypothetical protein EON60_10425 [Alphaproteobacteria bacterium]|nr:MAG: hypothetical protein EON60_10425 [Alphaproteobacteria bacterium]